MSHPALGLRVLCAIGLTGCSAPVAVSDAASDLPRADATVDVALDETPHTHADALPDTRDVGAVRDAPAPCPGGVGLPYPAGDTVAFDAPLPDLALPAEGRTVRLSEYYSPCAARPRLLVVRLFAPWSGPSRFHASRTADLLARPDADRLALLDVLGRSQENSVVTARDLALFRPFYRGANSTLALDAPYQLRGLFLGAGTLPMVLFIDPRTMRIVRTLDNPETSDLGYELSTAVARLDGVQGPPRPPPYALYDGRLSPDEVAMMREMTPPGAAPPDPTNRVADSAMAASFGRSLFVDPQLSPLGTISCATCHIPDRAFVDGRRVGLAVSMGGRNTPSVVMSPHARWQFWDGRADSLWSQALGPVENPGEMASSRLYVAHYVFRQYNGEYRALFGALPPLADTARFPASGAPGSPAWAGMTADDQRAVDTVFVNVGKSIAAFERTLRVAPTPFDAYVRGDMSAMSPSAREGLRHFFEFGCIQCHHGPTLSDDSFHNLHFGTGQADGMADPGRIQGLISLRSSPFRTDGAFSDAPTAPRVDLEPIEATRGQFHTQSLRGVSATGPWGHGGTFSEMNAVMLHYAEILTRPPAEATTGELDPHVGSFHTLAAGLMDLSALMQAMTPPTTPTP